jgi:hypothetical protein
MLITTPVGVCDRTTRSARDHVKTVSRMSAFCVAPLCPVAPIPSNPGLSSLGHIWATLGSQRARTSAK